MELKVAGFPTDPEHTPCEGEGDGCAGATVFDCIEGEVLSNDCSTIDPEFVCTMVADEPDRAHCSLPTAEQECEYSLSGDSDHGECDGTVARICAGGKWYAVDCSAFAGASSVHKRDRDNYPEPYCVL